MASVGFDFNYKIAISLDGAWVLFRQDPNLLIIADSVTGQQFNTLKLSPFKYRRKKIAISAVAKSVNQLWLIFVYEDNTFDEWFLAQIFAENTEKQPNPPFIYRAVSQNGQWALRETKRRCFQLHDLKANEITSLGYSLLPEIKKNDEYFWKKIILSNDAKFVITPKLENDFLDEGYNYERGLRYFDLINKNPIPILENNSYSSFSLSDDNKILVLGFENGKIEYYRLGNGEKFSSLLLHQSPVTFIKTKFIDGVLTTLSASQNGQIILFTNRTTAFKLENHVSLILFSPNNKNIIIGDVIGRNLDREQYHLFEVITPSVFPEKINLFLSSQEAIEKNSSNNYYILLGYDKDKNEVVYHYLQKNNERIIILFESSINAHFFNQEILKEDNFIAFTVEKVSEKLIKTFCEESGYSWEFISDKQDTLIEKSLHFWEIPQINPYINFWMIGPGFLNFKLYLNQRLYFKQEKFIDESRQSALPFFPIPSLNIWTDDLDGSLLFFFPSSHVYYKINFKISCLIANNQDGKTYMHLYYACVRADYQVESILLNFLEQQEKLLGRTHEKLIETLNNLYNIYSKQGKTTEAVAIMQRKEELEELYKPEEIILAASDACWMRAFIGEQETDPILDSSYIRFNVSPDKIFTPPLTLNIENEIMNSGEVIDIKKSDNNIELNTTKQIHVIYLVQEIRVLLSQIFENFQLIIEPDTNKIRLLKRIWNDIKLLFHNFDFQEDSQYLIHKIKTSQFSRQLKKFLKNPNNISHPAILVTFIIPVILLFIIGQDNNFSFTFTEIILTQNPLLLLRELISFFCFSFLNIVVLGSLAITPILIMSKLFNIDIITSYFTNKLSEREQKWLIFPTITFIPLYFLTFLIITISAIFVGISLTKEIAIYWTMKLATQPYWLIIISIGFLTWLGDLGEWILRKQRYRLSNNVAAIVGAIFINLLGNYLNQVFGKHFDPNSLLFNSSLAAVGGYGGTTQDRKNKNFIGALGAALASVYFINKYSLQVFSLITPSIEALSEKILYLIGLLIGILSGGFIGGFVGLLIGFFLATLFAFATFYFSFGVYHLAQQVMNDFQERGYTKTFTSIILMIITLFGSAFGLILSLIF